MQQKIRGPFRKPVVDMAKEAANIVLLEKDLAVLVQGVQEGRTIGRIKS